MKTSNKKKLDAMLKELDQVSDHIGQKGKLISAKELQSKKDEKRALVKRINKLLGEEKYPEDSILTISVNNTLKND